MPSFNKYYVSAISKVFHFPSSLTSKIYILATVVFLRAGLLFSHLRSFQVSLASQEDHVDRASIHVSTAFTLYLLYHLLVPVQRQDALHQARRRGSLFSPCHCQS